MQPKKPSAAIDVTPNLLNSINSVILAFLLNFVPKEVTAAACASVVPRPSPQLAAHISCTALSAKRI